MAKSVIGYFEINAVTDDDYSATCVALKTLELATQYLAGKRHKCGVMFCGILHATQTGTVKLSHVTRYPGEGVDCTSTEFDIAPATNCSGVHWQIFRAVTLLTHCSDYVRSGESAELTIMLQPDR